MALSRASFREEKPTGPDGVSEGHGPPDERERIGHDPRPDDDGPLVNEPEDMEDSHQQKNEA